MTTPAARVRDVGGRLTADRRFKRYGLPILVILLVVFFPFYATDRGAPLEFLFVDFLGMDIDTVFQMAEVAVSRDLFSRVLAIILSLRSRSMERC